MSDVNSQKLSRGALIALVVGSMVGAGIFTLPAAFARSTGVLGALISWAIAGTGMPSGPPVHCASLRRAMLMMMPRPSVAIAR